MSKEVPGISGVSPDSIAGRKRKAKGTQNQKPGHPYGEVNPNPVTPETRQRKGPICGAKRTGKTWAGPGICCQPAGWGTDHVGWGRCRNHGGLLPNVRANAIKQREISIATKTLKMYGEPVDKDPQEALLDLVHRTAGHVAWLAEYISGFEDENKLRQVTETGVSPSVWIKMYQDERKLLTDISKAAIAAGVAEREIKLKEEQGRLLAMVIQAILADEELELSPLQQINAPKIVRKHLIALEKTTLTPETLKAIAEGEVVDA